MYIQPCTTPHKVKGATLNFSSKNSNDDYYSYMAKKSNDIMTISSIGGACIGLISAKDNFKKEFIPKTFYNTGLATLTLFGLASINFFLSEMKNCKKETKN